MGLKLVRNKVLGGQLTVVQPARGERVGIDPVLLAQTIESPPNATAIDLGTGTGIIAALLLVLNKAQRTVAVEILPEFAEMARLTAEVNGLTDRLEVLEMDLRSLASNRPEYQEAFDLVVSNPPYRRTSTGKLPEDPLKAAARFELYCSLGELLSTAAWLLSRNGSAWIIYPAERFGELIAQAHQNGLFLWQAKFLHPHKTEPAKRVIAAFTKTERPVKILPPLVVHPDKGGGKYTKECEALLRGKS